MAITSYNELQSSVADWLNRADLASVVPDFITLATTRIQRDMARAHHPSALSRAIATFSDAYAPLPLDFIAMHQLMTDKKVVEYVAPAEAEEFIARTDGQSITGYEPLYFSIYGSQMRLFPAPKAGSPLSLTIWYYAYLPALTTSNQTNWVLQRYPDLYLYGSLVHSAPYLKADERLAMWEAAYQKILSEIEIEGGRQSRSQTKLVASARPF